MASESAERQQLEDLKAAEKERAEADVFATFERLNAQQQQAAAAAAATAASAAAAVETSQALTASSATSNATIWEDSEVDSDSDTDDDTIADTVVDTSRSTAAATTAAATAVDDATTATAADAAVTGHNSAVELQEEEEVRYTPAPRHGATVALGFTARLFPTPCRESKAAEEEAWIMKNRRVTHLQNVPSTHLVLFTVLCCAIALCTDSIATLNSY
jgi:hypothetical protein